MLSQKVTTIVLAVSAALLWGYIGLFEKWIGPGQGPRDPEIAIPWSLKEVAEIRIEGEFGAIRFERTGEKGKDWKLVEPLEDLADEGGVNGVVSGVVNLKTGLPVEGDEAKFGLDDPRLEIRVTHEDGDEATVEVGSQTALGTSVYVRFRGCRGVDDEAIWVVPGGFVRNALRPPEAFRDKALARFPFRGIRKMDLEIRPEPAAEPVHVALEESDKSAPWRMTSPHAENAEASAVEGLISALMRARAGQFVEGADEAACGLDRPVLVAKFADEEGKEYGPWSVGRVEKEGVEEFYGRAAGREAIFILGPTARSLVVRPDDFRLRRLFAPVSGVDPIDRFVGFRFGPRENHWSLAQHPTTGEWQIVLHPENPEGEPLLFPLNPQSLRDLKDVLRKFRIEEFVTEEPTEEELADWGIAPEPRWALGFVERVADAPETHFIYFGKVTGEGADRKVYAEIEGRGKGVVLLDAEAAAFSTDGTDAEQYRKREVWRLPPKGRVVRVETSTGRKAERNAEGKWAPEDAPWTIFFDAIVTRYEGAAWEEMTGELEHPAEWVKIGWEDEGGAPQELVLHYEALPARPAPGAGATAVPEAVKASADGVEGVFYLIPRQVWEHFDVPEPEPVPAERSREVWSLPRGPRIVALEIEGGRKATRNAAGEWETPEDARWAAAVERISARPEGTAWESETGQVEPPAAKLEVTWEDAAGRSRELVVRYEKVPERPAPGADASGVPESVKASVEGVEGVFFLAPAQVWQQLDVPESR